MNPEFEYFKNYSLWKKMISWLTGSPLRVSRAARPAYRYAFAVEYFKDHPLEVIRGSGRALSLKGVRFAAAIPPKKGQELEIRLMLPQEDEEEDVCIKIRARVIHSMLPPGRKRYRVGCEWIELSPQDKEEIGAFLCMNLAPRHSSVNGRTSRCH